MCSSMCNALAISAWLQLCPWTWHWFGDAQSGTWFLLLISMSDCTPDAAD